MAWPIDEKAKHIRDQHNRALARAAVKKWAKSEKERLATEKIQKENGSYVPPINPQEGA